MPGYESCECRGSTHRLLFRNTNDRIRLQRNRPDVLLHPPSELSRYMHDPLDIKIDWFPSDYTTARRYNVICI